MNGFLAYLILFCVYCTEVIGHLPPSSPSLPQLTLLSRNSSTPNQTTSTPHHPSGSSLGEADIVQPQIQNVSTLQPHILTVSEEKQEDQKFVNDTIEKYGFPKSYNYLGLPGPELRVDKEQLYLEDMLPNGRRPFNYTLRLRGITDTFSYNRHYEESHLDLKNVKNGRRVWDVKGQFGEHLKRKHGGYYVRTIGYILDENGYQQFLMDLSTVIYQPPRTFAAPGAPSHDKSSISSTVIVSLIGGNALGRK